MAVHLAIHPAAAVGLMAMMAPASAQDADQPAGWSAGVDVQPAPAKPPNTTVIERAGDARAGSANGGAQLKLVALLTADGQQIDQGLIWRIYQDSSDPLVKAKLIAEKREATPVLKLPAGDYTVNAAFGRAHITRKITLKAEGEVLEQFVLNAGGLRVSAFVGGKKAPDGMVTYSLFSDERDQSETRTAVMSGAKPNLILRLNAGIYRLVSVYGDANARIEADVTVEAGKLTEATLEHSGGKATFKLVTREGGEALPDTHWTVIAANGDVVKESVGALPTHMLAPGTYTVLAKLSGLTFKRSFSVVDGQTASVEIVKEGGNDSGSEPGGEPAVPATELTPADIDPTLDLKSP